MDEIVVDCLQQLDPGFRQQVEVVDVVTPLSFLRNTGDRRRSTWYWRLGKETKRVRLCGGAKAMPDRLGPYMARQWVEPEGAVPIGAASGRKVIQRICARDGILIPAEAGRLARQPPAVKAPADI